MRRIIPVRQNLLLYGQLLLLLHCSPLLRAQDPFPSLTIPADDSPVFDTSADNTLPSPNVQFPVDIATPLAGDFSITIRTDVLSRFVEDQRVQSKNVVTQVMEADVRGLQTTTTNVRLQSVSSSRMARLNIVSQGSVQSNTIGYTPQAQVATLGNHSFDIIKPVYFDGNRFLTKPAYGSLQARQTPQAVKSIASRLPLFGPIGDRIAWTEVFRRKPRSDSIVVRRVAEDVLPQVNESVEQELFQLNRGWIDLRSRLSAIPGGDQLAWSASSTTSSFSTTVVNHSVNRRTLPRAQMLACLEGNEVAAVVISQDGTNHLLGKLHLAGETISDMSLQKLFLAVQEAGTNTSRIMDLLSQRADFSEDPLIFSLKFAEADPLQFAFENGHLHVNLKFQVQPKSAPASQMHLMNIQLSGQNGTDGTWAIAAKQVSVTPASSNELPDAWTTLINDQASQMVARVPPSELPRVIDLRGFHEKLPVLRIHRIQSAGSQLRISFELDNTTAQVSTRRCPQ